MPEHTPVVPRVKASIHSGWSKFKSELNFFRIHLLFFSFTPLIFSIIFYAANGATHISYVDALFNCISAICVCGLTTIDLSSLTPFQQALLCIQSAIGSPITVSWVMVYIRRFYFSKRFKTIVDAEIARRKDFIERDPNISSSSSSSPDQDRPHWIQRFSSQLLGKGNSYRPTSSEKGNGTKNSMSPKYESEKSLMTRQTGMDSTVRSPPPQGSHSQSPPYFGLDPTNDSRPRGVFSDPILESDNEDDVELVRVKSVPHNESKEKGDNKEPSRIKHVRTVGFKASQSQLRQRKPQDQQSRPDFRRHGSISSPGSRKGVDPPEHVVHDDRGYFVSIPPVLRRTSTVKHENDQGNTIAEGNSSLFDLDTQETKNKGYGGFPYPTTIMLRYLRIFLPSLYHHIMQRRQDEKDKKDKKEKEESKEPASKSVNYITFDAVVGRNSKFHQLTEEHLEELGGVEYRALTVLMWLVAVYVLSTLLICFVIIAPYMSMSRWHDTFVPPEQHKPISPVWYSAFQVISAYTTTGMSLVDQSMVPYERAYLLLLVCTYLILAGNLMFPILLRFNIWLLAKVTPEESRLNETLHFLLDHPRRCYIYLFPSHQTWLLLSVVIALNAIEWLFFMVLNIGIPSLDDIPLGVRVINGLFQSCSARVAGFVSVSIAGVAPALQVLYVIIMYIGIYPISLSIQSTNVYEEKSLGVYEPDDEDVEPSQEGSKFSVWGRYAAFHARKQLAFDMWWLAFALFLICVIERGKLRDEENFSWFTIFSLIFEIISAYCSVGMSLGISNANYSLAGAFTTGSKLIIMAVILRGRHRGLPVAIDRAVMLPFEFVKAASARDSHDDNDQDNNSTQSRNQSQQSQVSVAETVGEKTESGSELESKSQSYLDKETEVTESAPLMGRANRENSSPAANAS